jgi:hypothetical protein
MPWCEDFFAADRVQVGWSLTRNQMGYSSCRVGELFQWNRTKRVTEPAEPKTVVSETLGGLKTRINNFGNHDFHAIL